MALEGENLAIFRDDYLFVFCKRFETLWQNRDNSLVKFVQSLFVLRSGHISWLNVISEGNRHAHQLLLSLKEFIATSCKWEFFNIDLCM